MDSTAKLQLPSTKAIISTAASAAATAMLVRSAARDFLPSEIRHYFLDKFYRLLNTFSNDIVLTIDEFEGLNKNHLYSATELYLGTITSSSTRHLRASLPEKEKNIHIAVGGNQELIDRFHGIQLKWRMIIKQTESRYVPYVDDYMSSTVKSDYRYIELIFHKKHKSRVINEYLPYVLERSETVKEGKKTLQLYTLKSDRIHGPRIAPWQSVNLDHPAKFETLAMDDEIKETIIADLDRFVERKDLYRKVGKAWKRGYLLYGPPGTGKSSLIAAMANYLNFDVYDLELTDLRCNSELRKLLISTANRSILVVEDIDASIDLPERTKPKTKTVPMGYHYPHTQEPKITLSGLLNFIDGLWSSCGDERIIVFTTNHKDRLDPALLRPGRMDVHIHMSYCTPCGFKMLVNNYLGIKEHPLLSSIEEMISSTKVTPAEIGEQLLKCNDPEIALEGLITFLEQKTEENLEEANKKLAAEKVEEELKLVGLKELVPDDLKEKILKRGETSNALKVLLRFLEEEAPDKHLKSSGEVAEKNGLTIVE